MAAPDPQAHARPLSGSRNPAVTGAQTASASGDCTLLDSPQTASMFERTYPGEPGQVRQVREDITRVFGGCPMAEELVLVASELATNAIQHSKSGDGGRLTVTVGARYGDCAWIYVKDQGGKPASRNPGRPGGGAAAHNADSSLGKGLAIVDALAGEGNWGLASLARTESSDGGHHPEENAPEHVAWVRIPWPSIPEGC